MSDSFSRDTVNQLREMGLVDPRDAEIERLTKELDEATDTIEWLNSNNLTLCAELAGWKQSARQMEAERNEAREQNLRLHYQMLHKRSHLETYGREKAREGMQQVIDRLRHEGQINPSLTYGDAIEWAEYVRNEMEALL